MPELIKNVIAIGDVETMSIDLQRTAKVGTISIRFLDYRTLDEIAHFYRRIDMDCKHNLVRTMDESTDTFWREQEKKSPEAFKEMFDPKDRTPLKDALIDMLNFMSDHNIETKSCSLFGNGPDFDNLILQSCCEDTGVRYPWRFWNWQSLRTPLWIKRREGVEPKDHVEFKGPVHHAGYDTLYEANLLRYCLGLEPNYNY